jgi:hypothetical protein
MDSAENLDSERNKEEEEGRWKRQNIAVFSKLKCIS